MVGAIADWFAVTALFRHPLGLPVPHTALIPERKDELGTQPRAVRGGELPPGGRHPRAGASAQVSLRVGPWLAEPDGTPARGRRGRGGGGDRAHQGPRRPRGRLRHRGDHPAVPRGAGRPAGREPARRGRARRPPPRPGRPGRRRAARLAGRQPRHLADVLVQRAPWWTPDRINSAVTRRIHAEMVAWLADIRADPDTAPARRSTRCSGSSPRTSRDPDTQARAERLKERLLDHPQVVESSVSLWNALRRALRVPGATPTAPYAPGSPPSWRRSGSSCAPTSRCAARDRRPAADVAVFFVDRYGDELTAVITHTIERWDGKEARAGSSSRRARPAVHPDQRHDRRWSGRRRDPCCVGDGALMSSADAVPIRDASIRLGQFLKLADLVDTGADAKGVLAEGLVRVNGDVETRRGRQLVSGRRGRAGRTAGAGGLGRPRRLAPWTSPRSTSPATSRRTDLVIVDQIVGDGAEATAGSTVVVTTWASRTPPARSSTPRTTAASRWPFRLGVGQVIQGWDTGRAGHEGRRPPPADHPAAPRVRRPRRRRRDQARRDPDLRRRPGRGPLTVRALRGAGRGTGQVWCT